MRTYAISCRPCLLILVLDLILGALRRDRRGGGGGGEEDVDEELIDITSGGSGSLFCSARGGSVGGQEDVTLPDGEGRNNGVFDGCRAGTGERDDDERLVLSMGGSTGLYHTTRMHTRRRKGRRYERIDTPVTMVTALGADQDNKEDLQSYFLRDWRLHHRTPRRVLSRVRSPQDARPPP